MSQERFTWLQRWVTAPDDIVTTPGTESNVREIYEACDELAGDPERDHQPVLRVPGTTSGTASARAGAGRRFEHLREADPCGLRLRRLRPPDPPGRSAPATTSRREYGAAVVAVEALRPHDAAANGFGSHNIQGIGDKHIPLIHHVHGTDVVVDVTDRATDQLSVLFSDPVGLAHLAGRRGVPEAVPAALPSFGLSSICNVVAAVKLAKHLDLGPEDVVVTVATDGARYTTASGR